MKKLNLLLLILNILYVPKIFTDVLVSTTGAASEEPHKAVYKWSNSSYVGYAWSKNAGVKNPDTTKFKKVAPGETDDANLGGVSYAGISLGHNICHWLVIGFGYEIYNGFNYLSYHEVKDIVSPVTGQEVINTNFIRSFNVTHQSALFNFYLDWPKDWELAYAKFLFRPMLGAGLGVGINRMLNFQTLALSSVLSPYSQVSTLGFNYLKNSLAWYVNLGIGFKPENTEATFGFGYRYYVGGNFSTGTQYILNDPTNEGAIITAAPWTGCIKTNQLKIFLDFDF